MNKISKDYPPMPKLSPELREEPGMSEDLGQKAKTGKVGHSWGDFYCASHLSGRAKKSMTVFVTKEMNGRNDRVFESRVYLDRTVMDAIRG
jgi:hypothetical protein